MILNSPGGYFPNPRVREELSNNVAASLSGVGSESSDHRHIVGVRILVETALYEPENVVGISTSRIALNFKLWADDQQGNLLRVRKGCSASGKAIVGYHHRLVCLHAVPNERKVLEVGLVNQP